MRRRAGLVVLAACALAGAGRAAVLAKTWTTVADLSGGMFYAAEFQAPVGGPATPAHITLSHESAFQPAPGVWDSSTIFVSWLPYDVALEAVAVMGTTIFVIGGDIYSNAGIPPGNCSKSCNTTLAFVQMASFDPVTGILGTINPATGSPGPWTVSQYYYGQTTPIPKVGQPTKSMRAIAVGNRVFVVGGNTLVCGSSVTTGLAPAVKNVYSAAVDPASGGNLGLWEPEPSLQSAASSLGLVYAAGALYAIGGISADGNDPQQVVQKAEVLPNGHLGPWSYVSAVPAGQPPVTSNPCTLGWCGCLPGACPDNAKCLQNNPCIGWERLNAFSLLNAIGFIGSEFRPIIGSAPWYAGTMNGVLNDCNDVTWTNSIGTDAEPDSGLALSNGLLVVAGGKTGASDSRVLWNAFTPPSGMQQAVKRAGTENTVQYVVPADGTQLKKSTTPCPSGECFGDPLPVNASAMTLVPAGNWMYEIANYGSGATVCGKIFRAPIQSTSWWVDSGAWVSKPYDLGGVFVLSRVEWAFDKNGSAADDDWMILKYRVAGPDLVWSCWTPRTPDTGARPIGAGHYVYASDSPLLDNREPLITQPAQYIQFKLDLYNDSGTDGGAGGPTLPVFDYVTVEGNPATTSNPLTTCLAMYPDPATDQVTFAFNVVDGGSEVVIRIYNIAGHLVDKEDFHYPTGGLKRQVVLVHDLLPGAYLARLESRSTGGGDGFLCPGNNPRLPNTARTVKGKFVVRR